MLEPHRCVFHGLQWVGQSFIIKCEINSFIVIIQQSKQKKLQKKYSPRPIRDAGKYFHAGFTCIQGLIIQGN